MSDVPVDANLHSSGAVNGFSICSLPSTGEMRTRRVPRATIRPRDLVDSLPSSSVVKCQ